MEKDSRIPSRQKVLADLLGGTIMGSTGLVLGAGGSFVLPTFLHHFKKDIDQVLDDETQGVEEDDIGEKIYRRTEHHLWPLFELFGMTAVGTSVIYNALLHQDKRYALMFVGMNMLSGIYELGKYMARRQYNKEKNPLHE